MIYRKRFSGTERVTFSLTPETKDGLEKIRQAFGTRYPKAKYPTLSLVLEQVIEKNLRAMHENPAWLEAEVAEFQRRYLQAKKGK
jgi:hypothetical protein